MSFTVFYYTYTCITIFRELRAKTSIAATSGHLDEDKSASALGNEPCNIICIVINAPLEADIYNV